MVFSIVSGSCARSALGGGLVLLRWALEERAIQAVPSAPGVLRDYLELSLMCRHLLLVLSELSSPSA